MRLGESRAGMLAGPCAMAGLAGAFMQGLAHDVAPMHHLSSYTPTANLPPPHPSRRSARLRRCTTPAPCPTSRRSAA